MPIIASQLIAKVSVDGAVQAEAQLASVGTASDLSGKKLALLTTGGLAVAGVGLAVIGGIATKMAGDFQAGMTSLVTGAGESASNIKLVSDGILNLATQTGTSTQDLTAGMYMIESAGYHGAQGLAVLQAAAEGAKVGNASLADVANGVTTEMTDYASSNLSASAATNILVAAVSLGKTHMTELAQSMSSILPTSAAVGVKLNDVAAALSTMTGEGTPASDAATYLRQLLMALEAPASASAKALAGIGLTTKQVSDEMKVSLPDTLKLITDHLKQKFPEGSAAYVDALKNIAGGSKQMEGILQLTGDHLSVFQSNLVGITQAAGQGGTAITGWSEVQKDLNFQLDRGREVVQTLMIRIGSGLLPVVTPLLANLINAIQIFGNWALSGHAVADMLDYIRKNAQVVAPVLAGLAVLIGSALVVAAWSFATAAWSAAGAVLAITWPVLAAAAGVAALSAIFVHFYTTNASFKTFMDDLGTSIKQAALFVQANFIPAIQWLIATVENVVSSITDWWNQANLVQNALGILQSVVTQVQSAVSDAVAVIQDIVGWFITWGPLILGVAGAITAFFLPAIIKAGVEAVAAGVKIATQFVQSVISSGTEAVVSGAKTTASFVASMVQSGTQAVINGAKVTASFVASVVQSGVEAVVSGAKVTASFVASIVKVGLEGWAAAGKLTVMIGQFIASGVQATIAAAQITASFIASMIKAGAEAVASGAAVAASFLATIIQAGASAVVTAGQFMASLIPAILAFTADAITAAATAIPAIIAGFGAWIVSAWAVAAANLAAFWPIYAVVGAIILIIGGVILAVKNWGAIAGWLQGAWANTTGFFKALVGDIGSAFSGLGSLISNVWSGIGGGIKAAINGVIGIINDFIGKVDGIGIDFGDVHIHANIPKIPYLASGVENFAGGLAYVHRDEMLVNMPPGTNVIPASRTGAGAGQSQIVVQPTPIYLDGRLLTQGIMPHMVNGIRHVTGNWSI